MKDELDHCPKCRRCGGLSSRLVLCLYPELWPFALLSMLIVVIYGRYLALGTDFYLACAFVSVVPVLMRLKRRLFCESCSFEISEDASEKGVKRL